MRTVQIQATPAQFKKLNTYAEKIGAKIITPRVKILAPSEKKEDPVFLDNREQCKRIQNEIIRGYNKKAKLKAEIVI